MRCIHAEKSVSIFQPDVAYTYADAFREYDYLIVAEVDGKCSLLAVEEVHERDEWSKRIIDLRTPISPVLWEVDDGARLTKALPGMVTTRGLVRVADDAWKRVENSSIIARWMASEPFNLIFWSALNLAPAYADQILEDMRSSAAPGCDSNALRQAIRHLSTLTNLLKKTLVDEKCTSSETMEVAHQLESASKMFDRILTRNSLVLVYPQLVRYEGEIPIRVRNQICFLSQIMKAYREKLSGVILMSNRSLKKQCRDIREGVARELAGDGLAIDEIMLDNPEGLTKLERYAERSSSILNLVLQDYNKRLLLKALNSVVGPGRSIRLMVIPEVRFRMAKSSPDGRMHQAQHLWRVNINDIKTCEVALLEPDELVEILNCFAGSRG